MTASLKDASVVVIGGSEGIGLAIARAATGRGAHVRIASRSADKLAAAQAALATEGLTVEAAQVDAGAEASVAAFFAALGEIDHLAVLAGGKVRPMPCIDTPMAEINAALHGKFWAQWVVAKYGAPRIRPGGSLSFTSGAASRRFSPGLAWLSTMNAGIEAMGRSLAAEFAAARVRVNVVCPGIVDTAVWDALASERKTAMMENAAKRLPVGFVAGPDDVAGAYLHLMESRYTTGAVLDIDGGSMVAS